MVSFIHFHFHFLAHFLTKTSPHMFPVFTHVLKPVRDTNSEPGLPVVPLGTSCVCVRYLSLNLKDRRSLVGIGKLCS